MVRFSIQALSPPKDEGEKGDIAPSIKANDGGDAAKGGWRSRMEKREEGELKVGGEREEAATSGCGGNGGGGGGGGRWPRHPVGKGG